MTRYDGNVLKMMEMIKIAVEKGYKEIVYGIMKNKYI